jgi:type II secretory pathway component PulF
MFILLVVFGVIFIMMTMVVPKLLDIFDDKAALPASTKTLIVVSDFFSNYWYLIILAIFMVIF